MTSKDSSRRNDFTVDVTFRFMSSKYKRTLMRLNTGDYERIE
jgi:hypothetical protein